MGTSQAGTARALAVNVEISASARADLADGFVFYERPQRGLGAYLLDSLVADIDSLAIFGGVHRRVFGAHRLLARTFPFAIYYDLSSSSVRVKAVLDCRRDPNWIREKLGGTK